MVTFAEAVRRRRGHYSTQNDSFMLTVEVILRLFVYARVPFASRYPGVRRQSDQAS